MKPTRLVTEEWLKRRREPYRLRCASCESPSWTRKTVEPRKKRVGFRSSPLLLKEKVDEPWDGQYRCDNCGETNDGVLDMKTGKLVCKEDDYISQEIDEYDSAKQKAPKQQRVK
jgi:hypothetical protein